MVKRDTCDSSDAHAIIVQFITYMVEASIRNWSFLALEIGLYHFIVRILL